LDKIKISERKDIPYGFYNWIHSRISEKTNREYIKKEKIMIIMRMYFNIEKEKCSIIFKELELLGFIEKEDGFVKVKKSKSREEIIFDLKKKLNMIPK